ncbi:SDR family NAD(P)-dependent oxidoreductase [Bradyrhizobium valentinum]|uniref:2-deoxy-D-gluconate 3-dehydrogenase n=1 Tax=Bradyrhizobium valentinum TaxID=1518501 RepID=A0A0R3L1K3_9BRAD|nr:SDR family oxidoreductase [Bradyrhizobium valentinum]KRR01698.1 2-deoxy-D-gluconate 3-dehydrogenase [Bradyrhizobium valentinum]KRR10345.1 2-deoxy-D-gluconate 3-dehydrogenase [Bradyrhizobium valentinum]
MVRTEQESSDWLGLSGRVCVVTGGGGGIGRATVLSFAKAGARVAAIDIDERGLEVTRMELTRLSAEHVIARCDTTDVESVTAASETIEKSVGACHVLVNTAAVLRPGALDSLTLAEWNGVLSVNLTGYFLCAQIFGRQMRAHRRGSLVHVASIAGSNAQGQSGAYSVSKAGVIMLSRQLANEWGPHGIRSNVVSPGMVITPMSQAFYDTPGVTERRSAVVPMRRVGVPQDMADAILFLASDRASYINGEEITVDGGYANMLMNLVPRPGFE